VRSGVGTVEATVDELVAAPGNLPALLEAGEPEERKAVVRAFLHEVRIDKKARQAVLGRFRLPRLDYVSPKLVELRGVEPLTPRLPALCSPN
jgi:hypothetical protein